MTLFVQIDPDRLEEEPVQYVAVHPLRWHRVMSGEVTQPQAGFREATAEELARFAGGNDVAAAEIDRLAEFILAEFPDEPGRGGTSESAVDVAIRLIQEYRGDGVPTGGATPAEEVGSDPEEGQPATGAPPASGG